jgi:hypothetical protein
MYGHFGVHVAVAIRSGNSCAESCTSSERQLSWFAYNKFGTENITQNVTFLFSQLLQLLR